MPCSFEWQASNHTERWKERGQEGATLADEVDGITRFRPESDQAIQFDSKAGPIISCCLSCPAWREGARERPEARVGARPVEETSMAKLTHTRGGRTGSLHTPRRSEAVHSSSCSPRRLLGILRCTQPCMHPRPEPRYSIVARSRAMRMMQLMRHPYLRRRMQLAIVPCSVPAIRQAV